MPRNVITPRQAARALAIGESTIKRWCDKGLIQTVRTAGGHRKLPIAEVLRFAREHNHKLVVPELLNLPAVSGETELGLHRSRERLVAALLSGDESVARQVVLNLHLVKVRLSVMSDEVIAGAFQEIGDRWACQEADVYQERRACVILQRVLDEVGRLLPTPDGEWTAIGATLEGDHYSLACTMAEMVLRQAGFQAQSLGESIPVASLIRAIDEVRPKLFWLSVSHCSRGGDLATPLRKLAQACKAAGAVFVVGGHQLREELPTNLRGVTAGESMQELERIALTMRQPSGLATADA